MAKQRRVWTLEEKIRAVRGNLKLAKAEADDNGWPRSPNWYAARQAEIDRQRAKLATLLRAAEEKRNG